MTLYYKKMKTPVGKLKLIANANAVLAVLWERKPPDRVKFDLPKLRPEQPVLLVAEKQLTEYFAGERTAFDLPLDPHGTEFQKRVWRGLGEIPFGETRTYRDLAKAVGSAKAVRAVARANGKNPLAIIVPCHRVIGSDGSLTGYAGGIRTKAALLALEAKTAASTNRSTKRVP